MNRIACPVCEYLTFDNDDGFPGSYNICPVCYWEDDPVQYHDHNYEGGANRVSVNQAKKNFKMFGACEESMKGNCRLPQPDEIPH